MVEYSLKELLDLPHISEYTSHNIFNVLGHIKLL